MKAAAQDAPQAPAQGDRNSPAFLDAASNQDEYFKCPGVCLETNASLTLCPCALPSLCLSLTGCLSRAEVRLQCSLCDNVSWWLCSGTA